MCCIFAKMVQMFIYANMETIGSMYTQQMFDLTRTETTQFNSILVSLSGFVGFAFLLTYVWTKLGKRIDNRIGAIIGVLICVAFLFTTYSWWFYTENIEHDGCHSPWCATTPKIPWELYAGSYVIVFGVGFAMMNVHLASMCWDRDDKAPCMASTRFWPVAVECWDPLQSLTCSAILVRKSSGFFNLEFGPCYCPPWQLAYKRLVPLYIPQQQQEDSDVDDDVKKTNRYRSIVDP
ncbi:hypothetical protein OSTOST_15402 [Ostertagia ostertagi]